MKKIAAVILSLLMLLTAFPAGIFAEDLFSETPEESAGFSLSEPEQPAETAAAKSGDDSFAVKVVFELDPEDLILREQGSCRSRADRSGRGRHVSAAAGRIPLHRGSGRLYSRNRGVCACSCGGNDRFRNACAGCKGRTCGNGTGKRAGSGTRGDFDRARRSGTGRRNGCCSGETGTQNRSAGVFIRACCRS